MSLVLHIVKKYSLLLGSTWQVLLVLFGFLFPSPCQSLGWVNKLCFAVFLLLFFYTQFKSSSLLVSSRISLSDRERSRKQPSTTITKQYSNNTSWDARSRCVLESVLDVFMLAWVMSSIAAAERNQSAAVNPWDVASLSPCCLLQFRMYISPWRETGFQVAGSHCGLNSHNLSTRCPLTKLREYWNWSMIIKAWLIGLAGD